MHAPKSAFQTMQSVKQEVANCVPTRPVDTHAVKLLDGSRHVEVQRAFCKSAVDG